MTTQEYITRQLIKAWLNMVTNGPTMERRFAEKKLSEVRNAIGEETFSYWSKPLPQPSPETP